MNGLPTTYTIPDEQLADAAEYVRMWNHWPMEMLETAKDEVRAALNLDPVARGIAIATAAALVLASQPAFSQPKGQGPNGGLPLIRDSEIEQLMRDYTAPILKAGFTREPSFLHAYFDVTAESPLADFEREAGRHPVFQIQPAG